MSGQVQGRSRAVKPSLKQQQLLQHKPRVPSRLSFSSLPPLPPLPATSPSTSNSCNSAKTPTLSSTLTKRSLSPTPPLERTKRSRPIPRPRKSAKITVEDALNSVGAFYIGWEQGKRDPAPLCCPVEKEKIKQRFGEAAVGWMTSESSLLFERNRMLRSSTDDNHSRIAPAPSQSPTTNLSMLPSLPIPHLVDTPTDFFSTPSYSPSPPSLIPHDDSSSSSSSYSSMSPPPAISTAYPFESTTTTNDFLLFPNSLSTASQTLALPLTDSQEPQRTGNSIPTIKVEDEEEVGDTFDFSDVVSEALWSSAAEDEGGFFSTGGGCSSGDSEASWAW
ncbi:hypothetical protein JCM5350_000262 [Sporobolomyces pararoseus]